MAKGESRKEAQRERQVAQRVSRLEAEVKKMRRTAPIPPAQQASMREARAGERADFLRVSRGNADYGGPVKADLARLRGRSNSELVSDRERGAGSPIPYRSKRR
jgi:hypothetical protein